MSVSEPLQRPGGGVKRGAGYRIALGVLDGAEGQVSTDSVSGLTARGHCNPGAAFASGAYPCRRGQCRHPRLASPARERPGRARGSRRVAVASPPSRRRAPSPPARPGRASLPPPFITPASFYLNARAHTQIVRLPPPPPERKNGESKRREGKEKNSWSAGSALPGRSRARGRGVTSPLSARSAACASVSASKATAPGDAARLFGARADPAAAAVDRRREREGPASASSSSPGAERPVARHRQAEEGERPRGGERSRGPGEARSGPSARGCGAPGAWRQLCRVTRREDCRARGRGLGAASERARAADAPRRSRRRARSAACPRALGEDDSPASAAGPSLERGCKGKALRCQRGGPPQRPLQRRAKPLSSSAPGAPAPSPSVSAKLPRPAL
ncbi:serine/arginine repetitive matrix protein 1 [Elephas maximus indicus]|uniref:serine/arginine repetitive matrix protein 1 n=1 Tax=Elephas maximus indicus TaxID=99487 RepID=UPI0021169FD1|nr:serine/arginine repetitive matrix protein 1 [Elephas maximus indicus]